MKSVNIPGMGALEMPSTVASYLERHDLGSQVDLWNAHLEKIGENYRTRTMDESIDFLLRKFSENQGLGLNVGSHSLGTRILMRTIITSPDILQHIKSMVLVCPPYHGSLLADQGFYKVIKRTSGLRDRLFFTDEFHNSLQADTEEQNTRFTQALESNSYTGNIFIVADTVDPILTRQDRQHSLHMQNFLQGSSGAVNRVLLEGLGHNLERL